MERNNLDVQNSTELRDGAQGLVTRAVDIARLMVTGRVPEHPLCGGGRKGHELDVKSQI